MVKNLPAKAGDAGSISGLGRVPWRRKWQPTPAFWPGESRGQRSLVGYSPWGCTESDTTDCTHIHAHTLTHKRSLSPFNLICTHTTCCSEETPGEMLEGTCLEKLCQTKAREWKAWPSMVYLFNLKRVLFKRTLPRGQIVKGCF